ncbi:glycosyltransferase family 4 protein [Candidatus Poribacteria bacterium]|nr:glycosyltransferase family 4 protein [Candidatus Poribacteria bacterium]
MKKPIVGFLSRLQPEKGGGTYLQIARMIPDALFVAVAPTLMFYEHVSLPDNFIYAGPQPRENLPLFFNAFDIHCFPSVVGEETFGMVALEAMACGTPVVASRFDGIPEVVGDTGVLVPAETYSDEMGSIAGYVSAEEMAKAIRELLDNPERRLRLGEMAHRRALGFTWEKAARELVELFDELNRRLRYPSPQRPEVSVFFTPFLHESDGSLDYQSILAGITEDRKRLLMFEAYIQSVEEGLALALLKHHTWHEVEVILYRFCGREEAKTLLRRVRQFLQALSV